MATIQDVSKLSGVSTATVSHVINGGPRVVRPETRQRVLDAMRELHYQPSAMARGLNRKRVNAVGVVALRYLESPLDNPYYRSLLSGIIDAASALRQSVTLFNGNGDGDGDTQNLMLPFCDGRCDGLLILAPLDNESLSALLHQQTPFVLIGEGGNDSSISSIDIDNVAAARQIVNVLIAKGHKRIAHFAGDEELQSTHERVEGYRQALAEASIPFDPTLILPGRYHAESGYGRTMQMFTGTTEHLVKNRPSAVFAANDMIAFGVIEALNDLGLTVPEQVSVAGLDGIENIGSVSVRLTTGNQHLRQLGRDAARMLLEIITSAERPVLKAVHPITFCEGETVAAPPL